MRREGYGTRPVCLSVCLLHVFSLYAQRRGEHRKFEREGTTDRAGDNTHAQSKVYTLKALIEAR